MPASTYLVIKPAGHQLLLHPASSFSSHECATPVDASDNERRASIATLDEHIYFTQYSIPRLLLQRQAVRGRRAASCSIIVCHTRFTWKFRLQTCSCINIRIRAVFARGGSSSCSIGHVGRIASHASRFRVILPVPRTMRRGEGELRALGRW